MRLSTLVIILLILPGVQPASGLRSPALFGGAGIAPQSTSQSKPEQKPQDQDEAIRLTSRLIAVPVSVSDAAGTPVRDLTLEDFALEEEGHKQTITTLGEPGKVPTEIAILFDISASIQDQFAFERQAAMRFIKEVLKPSDAVSVFSIGTRPKIVRERTTSTEEATAGVEAIAPVKEPTAFFDSVVEAALYLGKTAEPGSRRALVVISDGEENYSERYHLSDALRELQKNDCLFYSINPSGSALQLNTVSVRGQGYMESMATQTGGKAFVPEKTTDLEAVFRQITEELQAQYLLGYYSSDSRADGGFRRISVRATRRPDVRVRARQGYYTPAAK